MVHLVDSMCVLYESEEETTSHLPNANVVWNLCNKWIGVSSENHFASKEHFKQFHHTNKESNKLWKEVCILSLV